MSYRPPRTPKEINDMIRRWGRGQVHPMEMPAFQRAIAKRKPPASSAATAKPESPSSGARKGDTDNG